MGILKGHRLLFVPRRRRVLAVFCACLFLTFSVEAQAVKLEEQKIKAGLIYNFLKYTYWPADSDSARNLRLRLCLYGKDSFQGTLNSLEGRTAQNYQINILHIDAIGDLSSCSLVFIPEGEKKNLASLLRAVEGLPVLTVSDIGNFSKNGGIVEFATVDQRIKIFLNRPQMKAARLRMEDRLLRLAK
jgi:hypothetical protein